MNKMGEKHFREEESVRETIFRGKKLPLEVITCFRLDMFFGLRRQLLQDEILKIIFFSIVKLFEENRKVKFHCHHMPEFCSPSL